VLHVACDTSRVKVPRISLVVVVLAALAGAPQASASDSVCPTASEAEPVTGVAVAVRWHGGVGFAERCASTTGTGGAEPVAQQPATGVASPAAKPTANAVKAKQAKAKRKTAKAKRKTAKAKRKTAKAQLRTKRR